MMKIQRKSDLVNIKEADPIPEDKSATLDLILNLDTIDSRVETDPKAEEISHLEEEDSEPPKANQDFSGVGAKMKETNQSKGEFHL